MDRPGVRPPHRCSPRRRARAGPSATRRRSRRQAAAAEEARLLAEAATASRAPAVTRLDQELAELHRTAEELARHGALEADWRTATRTASAAAAAVALAKQERDQLGNRARRRRARTDRADAGGISRAACRADSHQPVTVSTVGSAEPLTREPSGGANTPGWPSTAGSPTTPGLAPARRAGRRIAGGFETTASTKPEITISRTGFGLPSRGTRAARRERVVRVAEVKAEGDGLDLPANEQVEGFMSRYCPVRSAGACGATAVVDSSDCSQTHGCSGSSRSGGRSPESCAT
jgi:hypothetical protein